MRALDGADGGAFDAKARNELEATFRRTLARMKNAGFILRVDTPDEKRCRGQRDSAHHFSGKRPITGYPLVIGVI